MVLIVNIENIDELCYILVDLHFCKIPVSGVAV